MAKLIITEDGRDKIYEIVDSEFTIGNSDEADLQIRDESAAGLHLTVRKTKSGYRIIDLETKSGTAVNGKMVNQHTLANGETIQIGDAKITYIGKGAAGPRSPSGKKIEAPGGGGVRNVYRRREQNTMGTGARIGIASAVLGITILLLWMMLSGSSNPVDPYIIEMRKAENELKRGDTESLRAARKHMKAAKLAISKTSNPAEMKKRNKRWKKANSELAGIESAQAAIETEKEAQKAWIKIKNVHLREPNNVKKLRSMCQTFMDDYKDLRTPAVGNVKELVANLSDDISPEKAALGLLESRVNELFKMKEYRLAWEATQGASDDLKSLYTEELEAIARRVRMRSRQVLTVRKNDVRHELRLKNPSGARELVEAMFDKLVLSTIKDYLDSPDKGYRNPETEQLELDTQVLLREYLKKH